MQERKYRNWIDIIRKEIVLKKNGVVRRSEDVIEQMPGGIRALREFVIEEGYQLYKTAGQYLIVCSKTAEMLRVL